MSRNYEKHGMSGTKLYVAWRNMINRCHHENYPTYPEYGGRGIRVCKRWQQFSNFVKDMGEAPTADHSLDRIDNNRNYSPSNTRWATRSEQQRNRRDNRFIEVDGKKKLLIEYCEETGENYSTLYNRLRREAK